MAKAPQRKRPTKRKGAAGGLPVVALSGWVVAGGLGFAFVGPQFGLWPAPPGIGQSETRAKPPRPSADYGETRREDRDPVTTKASPRTVAVTRDIVAPVARPILPALKPETVAAVARKADPRPAIPKPDVRTESASPRPPAPVPTAPLLAAAVRSHDAAPTAPVPTGKPGELAIRRYPFTTAPAVAYVADLRMLRIRGGQGDWKKVELTSTGAVGWLRLQRYDGTMPEG